MRVPSWLPYESKCPRDVLVSYRQWYLFVENKIDFLTFSLQEELCLDHRFGQTQVPKDRFHVHEDVATA